MISQDKTLNEIPLNKKVYIKELNCIGNIRRRLLDLGLVKGTNIKGTLIALRNEDANLILVSL